LNPPKIEVDGVFYAYKKFYFKTVFAATKSSIVVSKEDGSDVLLRFGFCYFAFVKVFIL
jgi:hypothetical protein